MLVCFNLTASIWLFGRFALEMHLLFLVSGQKKRLRCICDQCHRPLHQTNNLLQGCLGSGSRVVLLVNLSEAGPVNTSTAASLDWMHHLQSLSTARHMSAHTLTQDDSSTTAGHSMMQLHPVTSPPHLTATDEPPATVEAVDSATALKSVLSEARTLDSSAVLAVPAELEDGSQPHQEALVAEVEQLKARVQELLVCRLLLHCFSQLHPYPCEHIPAAQNPKKSGHLQSGSGLVAQDCMFVAHRSVILCSIVSSSCIRVT